MLKYLKFFFALFYLSIICPIICLLNPFVQTKKDIIYKLCFYINAFFRIKIFRISPTDLIHKKNIIYLTNHRSFADMFIDPIICQYSGIFIARSLVALVFPFSFIIGLCTNNSIFINRDNVGNIEKFFQSIELKRKKYSHMNLFVYPEGTRRYDAKTPCPLKKGFIYHSYNYNLPIQIIISKGKEEVINENKFYCATNKNIYVYYSEIINPNNQNETRDQYYDRVQNIWNVTWNAVFTESKYISGFQLNHHNIFNNLPEKRNKLYKFYKIIILIIWFHLLLLFADIFLI